MWTKQWNFGFHKKRKISKQASCPLEIHKVCVCVCACVCVCVSSHVYERMSSKFRLYVYMYVFIYGVASSTIEVTMISLFKEEYVAYFKNVCFQKSGNPVIKSYADRIISLSPLSHKCKAGIVSWASFVYVRMHCLILLLKQRHEWIFWDKNGHDYGDKLCFSYVKRLSLKDLTFSAHSMMVAFHVWVAGHRNTKRHLTDVVYDTLKPEENYDWK
jgi:hypothetical protein